MTAGWSPPHSFPKRPVIGSKRTAETLCNWPAWPAQGGVSHLLHMTFLPRRCGLLGHPCFVNPAMESPPAFCARVKSFLQDAGPALGR